MKKINKMNINGEVYDIQDNSSGYITGEEVDEKLNEFKGVVINKNNFKDETIVSALNAEYQKYLNGKNYSVYLEYETSQYRVVVPLYFDRKPVADGVYEMNSQLFRKPITTSSEQYICVYLRYGVVNGQIVETYVISDRNGIMIEGSNGRIITTANTKEYIPTGDYNPAVKKYVDDKFAEAIAMGYKTEVVEALPAENISHQVIYLVLNGDDEENNIYDEFVYNSNDEWEKIGSTKTDLSNYYNKQEVDDTFLEKSKELFKTIPVDFDNITDETKSILLEPTINYIENNIPFAIYDIVRNKFLYISNKLINNSISFSYLTADTLAGTTYKGFEIWWETDESGNYSITRINTPNYRNSNWFLSVNNNNSYTPTSNYNPATKKYVDDSITTALGDVNAILETLTTVEESEVSE